MGDWGPRAESSERDSTLKGDDNDKYMYILYYNYRHLTLQVYMHSVVFKHVCLCLGASIAICYGLLKIPRAKLMASMFNSPRPLCPPRAAYTLPTTKTPSHYGASWGLQLCEGVANDEFSLVEFILPQLLHTIPSDCCEGNAGGDAVRCSLCTCVHTNRRRPTVCTCRHYIDDSISATGQVLMTGAVEDGSMKA